MDGRATTGLGVAARASGAARCALRSERGGSDRCTAFCGESLCSLVLLFPLTTPGCEGGSTRRCLADIAAGGCTLAGRSRGGKGVAARRTERWRSRGGNGVAARRGAAVTRSRDGSGADPARVSAPFRWVRCSPAAWRRSSRWCACRRRAAASSRRACTKWGKRGWLIKQFQVQLPLITRRT